MHETTLMEIQAAIARLLPPGVAVSAGLIADSATPLAATELPATARMSARRLREFSAGRHHARSALGRLGLHPAAVAVGPDRAPRWPAGFVGSISHAGDVVVAVAAPCAATRAIGIDLEPAVALDDDLLRRVCRPEECDRLTALPSPLQRAKLIFSAKESLYKCVAPVMGIFLEFDDVEILFDDHLQRFRARGHGRAAALIEPSTITGAFAEAGGYWITAAWQPGPAAAQEWV